MTERKGKVIFTRFRSSIALLERVFKLIPRPLLQLCWNVVNGWHGRLGIGVRYLIATALAKRCGKNVFFGPDVEILGWEKLRLGSNISIQRWCYLDASGGIDIGNEVSIAHGVSMLSFDHSWTDPTRPIRDQPSVFEPVTIQDDVWIGAGVRILRGVVVRSRTIVAAGAVVTNGTTGNEIVGGVPARSLKTVSTG